MQTTNAGAVDVAYQTQRAEKCLSDFYNEFVAQGKHSLQGCLATVTRIIQVALSEATQLRSYNKCDRRTVFEHLTITHSMSASHRVPLAVKLSLRS